MKRKAIIITTLFSLFLLLMIPNVSAVEHHTVKESIEERLLEKISEEQLQFIKDKIQEYNEQGDDWQLILFKILVISILGPLMPILITGGSLLIVWIVLQFDLY